MERWQTFFAKANADIWTIIEQAINVAAIDHPKDFREKRGDIAETLFARHLVHMMRTDDELILSGSLGAVSNDNDQPSVMEEGELKEDDVDHETLLIQEINDVKRIIRDEVQPEEALLHLLQKLEDMQITVTALKVTEIGKQVNVLRKHPSKNVKAIVKRLVKHWKSLVDEWVKISGDTIAGASTSPDAVTGSHIRDPSEAVDGLHTSNPIAIKDASPFPNDEIFLGEPSKLFRFIDEDMCERDTKRVDEPLDHSEQSAKGSMHNSSRSQSGSALTYSSDCDVRFSASYTCGLRTPGEMGSATRDSTASETIEKVLQPASRMSHMKSDTGLKGSNHPIQSQPISKTFPDSRSSRMNTDTLKTGVNSGTKRSIHESANANRSHNAQKSNVLHVKESERTFKPSSTTNKVERSRDDLKLQIAKRKLHEGYQQAENAKKQRTVQVLDFPDLPKSSDMREKANVSVQSKSGSQAGQWSQSRRYG